MLEVKNIRKSFGSLSVLNGISFCVADGEVALITGRSGGGKTTLLRIILGLSEMEEGEVLIDGESLKKQRFWQNEPLPIGFVSQGYDLFPHRTALGNLLCVQGRALNDREKRTRAEKRLRELELYDKRESRVDALSGGQKQRLAIARALMQEPRVLLFDEPTAALDCSLTEQVSQMIQMLSDRGISSVVVSHDRDLLDRLNATSYVLSEGLLYRGNPPA